LNDEICKEVIKQTFEQNISMSSEGLEKMLKLTKHEYNYMI